MLQMLGKILFLPLMALFGLGIFAFFSLIMVYVYYGKTADPVVFQEGTAHGVTIGASRDQVYSDLIKAFPIRKLTLYGVENKDAPRYFNILEENAYRIMMSEDHWYIQLTLNRHYALELFFENDKLIKIVRYWPWGVIRWDD
jgi:hypothetical protein